MSEQLSEVPPEFNLGEMVKEAKRLGLDMRKVDTLIREDKFQELQDLIEKAKLTDF